MAQDLRGGGLAGEGAVDPSADDATEVTRVDDTMQMERKQAPVTRDEAEKQLAAYRVLFDQLSTPR